MICMSPFSVFWLFLSPRSPPLGCRNKRAARLALIGARVGTQGQRKKRGFSPAFLSFSAHHFRLGILFYGQSQAA